MPDARSLRSRVAGLIATGGALAFWFGFAPTSLGGDYSYAVVRGSSMEPHLRSGDIVLIRSDSKYGIGDAVAYRDPKIGVVLHRIVSTSGDRFVMRGDNRTTLDPFAPSTENIVGREAAVWRHGLALILALTSFTALGGLALMWICAAVLLDLRAERSRPRYRSATSRRIARAMRP